MNDERLTEIEQLADAWVNDPATAQWGTMTAAVPELVQDLRQARFENGLLKRIIASENLAETAKALCTEDIVCPRCGSIWSCSHDLG